MKRLSKQRRERAYELLETLVKREHCGACDETTCSIRVAFDHGYVLWAAYEFSLSGASSKRFDTLIQYVKGRAFDKQVELERRALVKDVSHAECVCGAYVWELEWNDGYCSNCGGNALKKEVNK